MFLRLQKILCAMLMRLYAHLLLFETRSILHVRLELNLRSLRPSMMAEDALQVLESFDTALR